MRFHLKKASSLLLVAGLAVAGHVTAAAPPAPSSTTTSTASTASCRRKNAVRVIAAQPSQGSTVAIAQWSGVTRALIADEDDTAVIAIDPSAKGATAVAATTTTTPLAGTPSQLLVLADGRVVVTLREKNRIQLFEPAPDPRSPLALLCEIEVATEPVGLASSPDGSLLLVTSEWGRALTMFETRTMSRSFVIPLARDPRGVIIDDDGKHAFVSHVVGGTLSVVDLDGSLKGGVREISLEVTKSPSSVPRTKLPKQPPKRIATKGAQGFALAMSSASANANAKANANTNAKVLASSKAGTDLTMGLSEKEKHVFAPMAIADPGEREAPPNPSGYGSGHPGPTELPFVSVIDTKTEAPIVKEVPFETMHRTRECLLPRAAAYVGRQSSRRSLLVACMGIDTLVELDASKAQPSRAEKSRWSVGAGPTGIALDANETHAVVWSQFDHVATVVTLDDGAANNNNNNSNNNATAKTGATQLARIEIPRQKGMADEVRRGRVLFHKTDDTRLSGDGRACASCHPDGREDGITWTTPMGPRQTIMLAGRVQSTAPYSWSGAHKTIEEHVTGTFQRLGGEGISAKHPDLKALLDYISTMKTPKSAPRDADQPLVSRGRAIFFSAQQQCATCHVNGGDTDGQKHIVTTYSADGLIDTPSLRFVRGTAPYFHDGRFASLDDLLRSKDHKMGSTSQLDVSERRALVAFLETL